MKQDSDQSTDAEVPPRQRRSSGCALNAFIAGVVGVGVSVWLLNRWDQMVGIGKAGTILLMVVSTLMILPMLLLWALALFVKRAFARVSEQLAEAGQEMLDNNKAMYDKIHEFRDAGEEDFQDLDRQAYDTHTKQLVDLGWRHLGDVVDATIEEMSGVTPVIRILASPDGTVTAGLFDFKAPQLPPNLEGKPLFMYDLASEFSDGEMLMTSNTLGLDMMTPPPQLHRRQYELSTPLPQIERSHETEKLKLLAAKGGTCTIITTLAEALEMERRQQAIKNAFRKGIGFIDPDEVKRIAQSVAEDEEFSQLSADAADQARKRAQQDES